MYHPDVLDRQLIVLLQRKGRAPYVELARALGVSEATVRRRVDRLLTEGVIEIAACADPKRIGLGVEAMIYLGADLGRLTQIGQRLAAMDEVREVIYTSGNFDLVVRVVLSSNDDLLPFLTQRVAPIAGIKATQTSYVLHVEKRATDWQLPEILVEKGLVVMGASILLVDDDPDFVAAARMVLEAEGYHVAIACNGREALACLEEGPPDLVLLDMIMEAPLAGLEVARLISADARFQRVPVLGVSAIRSSEWAGTLPPLHELPVDGLLDKPIEPGVLLETVRRLVG